MISFLLPFYLATAILWLSTAKLNLADRFSPSIKFPFLEGHASVQHTWTVSTSQLKSSTESLSFEDKIETLYSLLLGLCLHF